MDVEGRTDNANDNSLTLNIEHDQEKDIPNDSYDLSTAHTIDRDSWQQVGLMLVTGFNCGWIFSFSNLIMVPLGWTWGVVLLFAVGLYTAYANWLLAAFHFIDERRFIRYRDLMGFVYGAYLFYFFYSSMVFVSAPASVPMDK
ncbi:unnamed protein product [Vicia faba]|uniref:Amino acid transporter transmembrane domain-containing protein n=1 Tax=Vicia faba TaxID=3906 RepID=A0AAV1AKJ5_VICFA|nr:unnamed protein product [Vicia faba]